MPDVTDRESFEEFFGRTRDRALRSTIAATGGEHDAEDAVAEAFARAYSQWDDLAHHPAPEAWVMRTAINLLRDRHRRRLHAVSKQTLIHRRESGEDVIELIDPSILDAVKALPPRQREVLALRVLMDLSAETTATVLGISIGSVGTHLHRALAALRPTLDSAGTRPTPPSERNEP